MRAAGLLSAAAALTCCAAAPVRMGPRVAPLYEVVPGAKPNAYVVRFDPPPIYELWWEQIRECSGVAKPLLPYEALSFYLVGPDSTFVVPDSTAGPKTDTVYAAYRVAGRIDVVAIAAPFVMRPDIVRHEFLHEITAPLTNPGHPASVFRGACDSLVYHAAGT